MRTARNLDARALEALYDEGYYHGVNSGYPAAGYESVHASWAHWVEHLARTMGPGRRWLDLGCAHGYLVAEAVAGGFVVAGADVSAYALGRSASAAPLASGRLVRSLVETLPFGDATFDVVSAFDVLEHLIDPEAALREAHRVLRPGGCLIGATPDPLVFGRPEATHFSERPPSYWIDLLLALDFQVDLRFFQAPYNLELLARREARGGVRPAGELRPEGFGDGCDVGTVSGPAGARVAIRLRSGFGTVPLEHGVDVRWVEAGGASAYVLVTGRDPLAVGCRLEVRTAEGATEIRVALDDQDLGGLMAAPAWSTATLGPIPVAAGGHALHLRARAPLFVRALEIVATTAVREDLLVRLPFDMFQRYHQCRVVVGRLPTPPDAILDVGGALGGTGGHLATTRDFFPASAVVTSVDARVIDHPDHRAVGAGALPFADASFDLVLCQDVLEHVPPPDRAALLAELARVSRRFVLLAAPFAAPGVAEADALLFALVRARHGYVHRYLDEHLAHGHPDLTSTLALFEAAAATVEVLPNGYLPYWSVMQVMNLRLAEPAMGERYARAQAEYNRRVHDWREPAYRHLVVVDLAGGSEWRAAVRALADPPAGGAPHGPGGRSRDALAGEMAIDEGAATAISAVLDLAYADAGPPARHREARAPSMPAATAGARAPAPDDAPRGARRRLRTWAWGVAHRLGLARAR